MQDKNNKSLKPSGIAIYNRESVDVSLNIAKDTFDTLERVAQKRDLSVASLLKLFIGRGLRELEPEMSTELAIRRLRNRKSENVDVSVDLAA